MQAVFYELSAEDMSEVSMKHEIQAVPTVLLFRAGKAVDRWLQEEEGEGQDKE